jgi:hypothetical protein
MRECISLRALFPIRPREGYVRLGSIATELGCLRDVRFPPVIPTARNCDSLGIPKSGKL